MAEPKRILLAEDNLNDIELTLAVLAGQGLAGQVTVVRDGSELLDFLYCRGNHARRPAGYPVLIILDIKMPKVGGLEVLRVVKQDEVLKTIPIVMLTSSREPGDVARSYQLGANAYVVKPVDFRQFSIAVEGLGLFWAATNETPATSQPHSP